MIFFRMENNIMDKHPAISQMIEVELPTEDDFLKIKETLNRIGLSKKDTKTLYPSCVILHKQGKYYISHFKTMFMLDGRTSNIDNTDIMRLRTISHLLEAWGLCRIKDEKTKQDCKESCNPKLIKIVPFAEKDQWKIVAKYTMGS